MIIVPVAINIIICCSLWRVKSFYFVCCRWLPSIKPRRKHAWNTFDRKATECMWSLKKHRGRDGKHLRKSVHLVWSKGRPLLITSSSEQLNWWIKLNQTDKLNCLNVKYLFQTAIILVLRFVVLAVSEYLMDCFVSQISSIWMCFYWKAWLLDVVYCFLGMYLAKNVNS